MEAKVVGNAQRCGAEREAEQREREREGWGRGSEREGGKSETGAE